MSKVALSGNASGTGTFTIASPSGNTDRTINLPDSNGTILTTATPGVPVNGPLLISSSSSAISISANTATTFSSFGTPQTDTASCFNISNGRFTPTVAGYYQVTGFVYYSNSGVNSIYVSTMIYKNGVESFGTAQVSPNGYPVVQATGLVYLNGSTDYLQVYAYIIGASATTVVARIHAFLARSA